MAAVLDAGADRDADELLELTHRLREELLELDVDSVAVAGEGKAPAGAKGVELLALGGLVLRFALDPELLRAVVGTTVAWLGRQDARSVKLTLDDDTLEVTGISSEQQRQLIDQWVARHADAR